MTLKGESGSLGRKRIMNIHLARFPNSSGRMGHKANTSTWCVLETEMQIPAKFVNTKIGGIIMSKYVVWYKTKSGKFTREIPFTSYDKALSLFNALKRDFKYLIKVDVNGNHNTLLKEVSL